MAITQEQASALLSKGVTLDQINRLYGGVAEGPGIGERAYSALVKEPIGSVLRVGYRAGQAIGGLGLKAANVATGGALDETVRARGGVSLSDSISASLQKGSRIPFIGGGVDVNPLTPGFKTAQRVIGETGNALANVAAFGAAPAAAGSTAAAGGMLRTIGRGALEASKIGAKYGAAFGASSALEQEKTLGQTIGGAVEGGLFGAAAGAALGGTLAGAIKAVPVTISGVRNAAKLVNDPAEVARLLEVRNRQILKPTPSQLADWSEQKVDPIKTFTAEFGPEAIPTLKSNLHLDDFIESVDLRYKAGAEGFNKILRESPEVVSLSQAQSRARANVASSRLKPLQKEAALAKIDAEFDAVRREASDMGLLNPNDTVPAHYADSKKDSFWLATKNFGTEEASLSNEVNYSVGTGFKEGIEKAISNVDVRDYNKSLQNLIVLKNFLESRNGRVPGTGGMARRLVARVVGAAAGSKMGTLGSIAGSITGDQLAQALIRPGTQTWVLRRALQRLSPQQRESLAAEANAILSKMSSERASVMKLPATAASERAPSLTLPANVGAPSGQTMYVTPKGSATQSLQEAVDSTRTSGQK